MKTILKNGIIVNEGVSERASVVITDDRITDIIDSNMSPRENYDNTVDLAGCFVFPGIIDSHVHFREPGMTHKADMESESREAARGGVTTFFDMPNTVPQTTTAEAIGGKLERAAKVSAVNYAFFIGATNDNAEELASVDCHIVPGIKLFMGSSTGNMLVDRRETLEQLFKNSTLPIMAHCEDTAIINRNMEQAKKRFGGEPPVACHPSIRSEEACYASTALAVSLARKFNARLHVAHLTTARELELFRPDDSNITAEAVIAHLWFCDEDYERLGTRIKCNPAVKTAADRDALRKALTDGRITTVSTDHAPHLLSEKEGGCCSAASGMPMVRYSLSAMLQLVEKGVLSMERVAHLMCHQQARLFGVRERGFIRKGYKADLAVVSRQPLHVDKESLTCRCGWSPMEGETFDWQVVHTFCNGRHVCNNGIIDDSVRGEQVMFR